VTLEGRLRELEETIRLLRLENERLSVRAVGSPRLVGVDDEAQSAKASAGALATGSEDLNPGVDRRIENGDSELSEATVDLDHYFTVALDLFCIAGMDGVLRKLNPAWERTLGYLPSDLEGMQFMDLVHPDDRAKTEAAVGELANGKNVLDFTNRYRCRDGTYRWIEWRSAPYRGSLIYAAARDVTERIEAEKALRESEQRFRSIVESSPMGIHMYLLETDGRLIFTGANSAADTILGVDNSQFLGRSIEEAFPPLAGTEVPERYRQASATGAPWSTEQVIYADGQIQGAYEVHAFQTAPGRMAALFLDITERKRAEQERERLSAELRQAQKMEAVGRLAGGVAHDFNNLLTGILGYCDLITERVGTDDPVAQDVGEIRSAGERAAVLTRQLLAFSRKQIMQPRVISVAAVVSEVQKLVGRLLGDDVELDIRWAKDVGAIRADPVQVQQVILNLAINARDAMPEGGRLTIACTEWQNDGDGTADNIRMPPGRYVLVTVTDTGSGMDAETLSHIFEPFFTTKEVGKGTGLGLATVHGIVTQSGGSISVASAVGEGTTFRVYFPRVAPAEEDRAWVQAVDEATEGSEIVLLVEDSPEVRGFVHQALTVRGYTVLEATGPEEALATVRARQGRIDLLLTDVVMPGMSGPALAQQLTRLHPGLKVLFMSGYTEESAVRYGVLEHSLNFIQKPFRPDALSRRIRQIMDESNRQF
jgi:two-component system, cell cycle sensor histidine kinase and response regulator CckA